jgi:general secretion pathway protein H
VLIIVIMLGLAGVRLTRGEIDLVREEADRLALLLQAAQQEAMLQGRVYALATARDGYQFLSLDDKGRLRPVKDDLLRERRLAPSVRIAAVRVDGAGDDAQTGASAARDGVVLAPSGEVPAFSILFAAGEARWYVVGRPRGGIRSQSDDDSRRG